LRKFQQRKYYISSIEIYEIIDSRINKTVTAMLNNRPFQVILWSGDEYDNIGQWTDVDVQVRIKELYTQ
jgi:hypothetical protein